MLGVAAGVCEAFVVAAAVVAAAVVAAAVVAAAVVAAAVAVVVVAATGRRQSMVVNRAKAKKPELCYGPPPSVKVVATDVLTRSPCQHEPDHVEHLLAAGSRPGAESSSRCKA